MSEDEEYQSIKDIIGIDEAIEIQKKKLERLRNDVKPLEFKKIDVAGAYSSIAYSAIDGGKTNISLNPYEISLIEVADSNGNTKLRFVFPEINDEYDSEEDSTKRITEKVGSIEIIDNFVKLLGCKSLTEISYILKNSNILMEISEWACIFDRVTFESDEPIIIMKDGLLRTKAIKPEYIERLIEVIKKRKKHIKLIGVSKTSAIISLLSTALFLEKKIPKDTVGYVKIPLDLELKAYEWSGVGKAATSKGPLKFAFGELYIAKLAANSNLLVTLEIPGDLKNNQPVYSEDEISEIISYLAKDSRYSYPVIGYPQTIMRAHEAAVRVGFKVSLTRDEIRDKVMKSLDDTAKDFLRDSWLLTDIVNKGVLGGGNYD